MDSILICESMLAACGLQIFHVKGIRSWLDSSGPKMATPLQAIEYDIVMLLDRETCSRARLARDARFDGKFFIAVRTTKIYCRPICRSRTSKESNVEYFPSAAAAAEAGFRPCLRCHPELSPGTPAYAGTRTTVTRALRLIDQAPLEDGIEALASRLGIGPRHLSRLFRRHLGASPSAVVQTRRLQFAKKLIDETDLPMTQVALASGFGSVRRFNDAIHDAYDRTPSSIRRSVRKSSRETENQYTFRLSYRPPYDWERLLELMAARAVPGVELVGGSVYRRSVSVNQHHGYIEVSHCKSCDAIEVRVQIDEPRSLFFIIERIRAVFDLDADWAEITRTLGSDPDLGPCVSSHPGLRVPGCWDSFELATRAILEQQKGNAKVKPIVNLVRALGEPFTLGDGLTHLFPTPESLAIADLKSIGISDKCAFSIRAFSRAVCSGKFSFEKVTDYDLLRRQLSELPGFTRQTMEWVAMCGLRDPDAFPLLDQNVARSLAFGSLSQLEERSLSWSPWRAYAALYLLMFAEEIENKRCIGISNAGMKMHNFKNESCKDMSSLSDESAKKGPSGALSQRSRLA